MIDLPFDPEERFHNYGFKWTSRGIWWYVDEVEVYNVSSKTHSIPKQRESSLRIMMNLWVVSKAAAEWAGWFKFKKELVVRYDAVRYTKGESCRMKGFNNDLWRIRG